MDMFGGMTGQNIMQALTTKNFTFLRERHLEIQANLKRHLSEKGEEEVKEKLTEEIGCLMIPTREHAMIGDLGECQGRCRGNLRRHVGRLIQLAVAEGEQEFDVKVITIGK
jgi:hypothetical protein